MLGVAHQAEPHLVLLRKRPARVVVDGGYAASFPKASFYTARVLLGGPNSQPMHVSFDTASGQVVLPSSECSSTACLEHRRYRPEKSERSIDINADGTLVQAGSRLVVESATRDAITVGFSSLDLGDGGITGHFLADELCLPSEQSGSSFCSQIGLVAAQEMSDVPFRATPHDGTIGLGLKGLSIKPAFNYLDALSPVAGASSQFALYHGRHFGEVALGGYNEKRLDSPLQWVPVAQAKDGYWQVDIRGISVGGQRLQVCQGDRSTCRGILDSCTSQLGVPASMMPVFKDALAVEKTSTGKHVGGGCPGPEIQLELSGGVTLTLQPEDYHEEGASRQAGCSPDLSLASLELPEEFAGVFILGLPLMKRYYTVFDWQQGQERLGFGLAAPETEQEVAAATRSASEEDLEEMKEVVWSCLHEVLNHVGIMFQAIMLRVAVVLILVVSGSRHLVSGGLSTQYASLLAKKKLLLEVDKVAPLVPAAEVPVANECVICLGSCEECEACEGCGQEQTSEPLPWRRLQCGHHFHSDCILQWLKKVPQCPVCRCHLKPT